MVRVEPEPGEEFSAPLLECDHGAVLSIVALPILQPRGGIIAPEVATKWQQYLDGTYGT